MGCSKPAFQDCPRIGTTAPQGCFGCNYYVWDGALAKTIDQFTTDELIAEIRRRMK